MEYNKTFFVFQVFAMRNYSGIERQKSEILFKKRLVLHVSLWYYLVEWLF